MNKRKENETENMEEYHNLEDFIPKAEINNKIEFKKSDYRLLQLHTTRIENEGNKFTEEETTFYIYKYDNTSNIFMKCLYISFLKNSQHFSKYKKDYIKRTYPLYPKIISKVIINKSNQNIGYINFFFEEFVNCGYILNNWQDIIRKSCDLLSKMRENKIGYIRCLIHLISVKHRFLRNIALPPDIDNFIDDWVEKYDGNTTLNPYSIIDPILTFYEKYNNQEKVNQLKSTFSNKMLSFISYHLEQANLDEKNMQHLMSKKHFLNQKLTALRKLSSDSQLKNEIKMEIDEISKKFSTCTTGYGTFNESMQITEKEIRAHLEKFDGQSFDLVLYQIMRYNYFIPIERKDEDFYTFTGLFGTQVFYPNGKIKKVKDTNHKPNEKGNFDMNLKWKSYQMNYAYISTLFEQLIERYDKEEVIGMIAFIFHNSTVFDEASEILCQRGLIFYFSNDYISSINSIIFQIEAILRNICNAKKKSVRVVESEKERQSGFTALINTIIKFDLIEPKLLTLIKWLLLDESDQIGCDLRNSIAHGLTLNSQIAHIYTKYNAIMLILIVIKLAGYGIDDSLFGIKEEISSPN